MQYIQLPHKSGPRPETTPNIPHVQIGVEVLPYIYEEMARRVYAIPGIEDRKSVIASWRGMWLSDRLHILRPEAILGGREFGHIHHDASLHIFLEPTRADEAVESGWAIHHPFALENRDGWDGFVMLYTPQSLDELDITMQLIMDGYNFVTGQDIKIEE